MAARKGQRRKRAGGAASPKGPTPRSAAIPPAAWIAAWIAAAVAAVAAFRYGWALTCDDGFISFRYAENLAAGHGLCWNPGVAVEGYSNFLWVVLLAAARALGAYIPAAASILSVIAGLALLAGAGALARALSGASEPPGRGLLAAGLAALLLALDEDLLFWMTSGLETTAYSAAVVWALAFLEGAAGASLRRRLVGSALLCVVAALLRPDGHLLPIALGAVVAWRARRSLGGWTPRRALVWAAIVATPLAAYHLFRVATFGDLLPNTWHARQGAPQPLVDGLVYLGRSALDRGMPAALALGALAWRKAPLGAPLWLALVLGAGIVAVGGDWMAHQRLLLPLAAPLAAAAAAAAPTLVAGRRRATLLATALLLPCAIVAWPGLGELGRVAAFQGARPESAQEGTMVEAQRRAAAWVVERAEAEDLVVANHVGAFGFEASSLEVLDMVGLTDRHMARARGEGLHRRFDLEHVVSREPDWVILNSRRRPEHGEYPGDYWPGETMLARSPWFRSRCIQEHVEGWRWTVHPTSYVLVYRCGEQPRAVALYAPHL